MRLIRKDLKLDAKRPANTASNGAVFLFVLKIRRYHPPSSGMKIATFTSTISTTVFATFLRGFRMQNRTWSACKS
jgi:hypothetical protein